MSEKGPLQIIADLLPLGPDEWVSDRLDLAHEILIALDSAGFVIHARMCEAADRIEQLEAEILSLHNLLTKWSDGNKEMADRIEQLEGLFNRELEATVEHGKTIVTLKARIEQLEARVVDAEIALNVWDKSHASEYWLRWRPCHSQPNPTGRKTG